MYFCAAALVVEQVSCQQCPLDNTRFVDVLEVHVGEVEADHGCHCVLGFVCNRVPVREPDVRGQFLDLLVVRTPVRTHVQHLRRVCPLQIVVFQEYACTIRGNYPVLSIHQPQDLAIRVEFAHDPLRNRGDICEVSIAVKDVVRCFTLHHLLNHLYVRFPYLSIAIGIGELTLLSCAVCHFDEGLGISCKVVLDRFDVIFIHSAVPVCISEYCEIDTFGCQVDIIRSRTIVHQDICTDTSNQ